MMIGTPMVIFCCLTVFDDWYTVGTVLVDLRPVTIGTPMVIFCCFDYLLTVFDDWYTVGTVLVDVTCDDW